MGSYGELWDKVTDDSKKKGDFPGCAVMKRLVNSAKVFYHEKG
jgi:hypothetical protein